MTGRVVLAMSGGVDSSAAAVLLHQQGYDVIGLFMRSGESTGSSTCAVPSPLTILPHSANRQGCCSAEDAADARRVADRLGIPFHSLNFQDSFRRIKDYFADEYLAGRTPNPCVQCNNWLKFGKLWDFARQVDADFIATGHYAQVRNDQATGDWGLFRGLDDNKDQSYVLYGIAHELLSRVLLPVGTFLKPDIRQLAADAGLRVATKKDSYEICFVPDNDYAGFLKRYRPHDDTSGEFVNTDDQVLGHHDGYEQFTVGQRKGLGIAFGEPRFVVRIHADSRRVVLGTQADLETRQFRADRVNWLVTHHPPAFECEVKVRYRQASVPCHVQCLDGDRIQIEPVAPIAGVAPGQAAVLYSGDQVLGGGWIQSPGD